MQIYKQFSNGVLNGVPFILKMCGICVFWKNKIALRYF